MATLVLGTSAQIDVVFYDWAAEGDQGSPIDPDSVEGHILAEDESLLDTFTPTRLDVGAYQYVWTPATEGTYIVEFVGTYSDGQDTIREEFIVSEEATSTITTTLGEDYVINFMPQLDPLYFDLEEILAVYPDATKVEVAQLVNYYSNQVVELTKSTDLNGTTYEYIKASTLCALSKVYDLADNEMTFTLGDMTVVTQRFAKTTLGRANATTWCELAAVLRREMLNRSGQTGIKATLKGSNYCNPMPPRFLRTKNG